MDRIDTIAKELRKANYAVALTGAGISTESGIQDYRGPQGVWTLNPEAERKASKSFHEFMKDPGRWWENILFPSGGTAFGLSNLGEAQPNIGHYVLSELEDMGIIKSVITQNVDSLHEKAGTRNLIEFHGSMSKFRCLSCGKRFGVETFDLDMLFIENRLPPRCPECNGLIKTDGVFFGEPIPEDVVRRSIEETSKCDLMLICGTSAVVYPFASLPRQAREKREKATIIEINAEPTPLTLEGVSDYFVQGMIGDILPQILNVLKALDTNDGVSIDE